MKCDIDGCNNSAIHEYTCSVEFEDGTLCDDPEHTKRFCKKHVWLLESESDRKLI